MQARDHEPTIEQAFIAAEGSSRAVQFGLSEKFFASFRFVSGALKKDVKKFEAALFVLRKRAANLAAQQPGLPFYAPGPK